MGCCFTRDRVVETDVAAALTSLRDGPVTRCRPADHDAPPVVEDADLERASIMEGTQAAAPLPPRPVGIELEDAVRWHCSDMRLLHAKFAVQRLGTSAADEQPAAGTADAVNAVASPPRPAIRSGRHRRSGSATQWEFAQMTQQRNSQPASAADTAASVPTTVGGSHRRRVSCLPSEVSMLTQATPQPAPPTPPVAVRRESRLRPIGEDETFDMRSELPHASLEDSSRTTARNEDVDEERSLTPHIEAAILALAAKKYDGPTIYADESEDLDFLRTRAVLRARCAGVH
eukprot:TRINITY_DN81403_c0_g1_i1.p1 TRINITY_DN81403_c0_g1~~TRINITY_DN81403_c0_g1_i1.p1  ORF type:complete len:288 (-),score=52.76 TRINITY_DN81403_c0_g1_i1:142-1005(-)